MTTLLIINDNSPEANHAAEFALLIAQKMRANIILANTFIKCNKAVEKIPAGDIAKNINEEQVTTHMLERLNFLINGQTGFKPEIEEYDISDMDESQVAEVVNKNQLWLIVKGMADLLSTSASKRTLNVHTVLNKVLCPLLLVPATWQLKHIERLVYIADLRYCRIQIVRFLAELAKPWHADLLIANMSAKGLPDMAEKYAMSVFSDEISCNVNYDQLYFNNIKEKDLTIAIDVMINGMHNDLLVMVNHRFHFEEIIGRYITNMLPSHITIPLLIFPC